MPRINSTESGAHLSRMYDRSMFENLPARTPISIQLSIPILYATNNNITTLLILLQRLHHFYFYAYRGERFRDSILSAFLNSHTGGA